MQLPAHYIYTIIHYIYFTIFVWSSQFADVSGLYLGKVLKNTIEKILGISCDYINSLTLLNVEIALMDGFCNELCSYANGGILAVQ